MTDLLADGYVTFRKKPVDLIKDYGVSGSGIVTLVFEDGTRVEADCVIACDGIKSRVC